jgi:hypothetical protein
LSKASRDSRSGQSLRDLIFSRFEHFLAIFVISASIIVIVVALTAPFIENTPSQAVVQGMTAIVSGVIGFYFGNRGAERAEERVREVENQLARGALGIQQERIGNELGEIHAKIETAIEQAQKASELHRDAFDLHRENLKKDADRYFRMADELIDDCYSGMKAWIIANHAWLKLDQTESSYVSTLDMFNKSQEFYEKAKLPSGLFPKFSIFGEAIAQIRLGDIENAVRLLNSIGNDIAEMNDLFELEDLKETDVDRLLEPRFDSQLNENVKKYLKKAKSYYEQKKLA